MCVCVCVCVCARAHDLKTLNHGNMLVFYRKLYTLILPNGSYSEISEVQVEDDTAVLCFL